MSIVRLTRQGLELSLYYREKWQLRLLGASSTIVLVWIALSLYINLSYYQDILSSQTLLTLKFIALFYGIYSIFFYALAPERVLEQGKGLLTARAIKKIAAGIGSFLRTGPRDYTKPLTTVNKNEKTALLFTLVKLFFAPLMVQYFYANYHNFAENYSNIANFHALWSTNGFNHTLYPILLPLLLFIDTTFFAFGYIFEAGFLRNKLRSVEPTALGWFVALICYVPFSGLMGNYVTWYASDFASFSTPKATFFLHIFSLSFMAIYASASVALGAKASNLTNRGIVGYGPYRLVRHPAYTAKNIAWWITILPVFSLAAVVSMSIWSFIYFMRAITEERHLSADPEYLAYCKKVRHRFIPGVI